MRVTIKAAAANPARAYLKSLQSEITVPLRWARSLGTLHGLLVIAQFVAIAWWIHQAVIDNAELTQTWPVLLLAVVLIVARGLANYAQQRWASRAGDKAQAVARSRLLARWRYPLGQASGEDRASVANTINEPIQSLSAYYARFQVQMWIALMVPLFIILVVAALDWIAALFLFFAAPIIPLFMALVGMGAESLNRRHLATTQRLSGLFVDRVRNLTNLRLFNATTRATTDIAQASDECRRANMATLRVAFLSSAVLEFFAAVAIAAVAIYVGFSLLGYFTFGPAAQMTLFSGLAVLLLAPEFFQPLRTLSQFYHDRAAALAAAELLARHSALPIAQPVQPGAAAKRGVDCNNLHFSHPGRPVIFNGWSGHFQEGEISLLHGPSGAGKSTLLQLITGVLPLQGGDIRIFGELPATQAVAYLAQRPHFAHGSVADNLRLVVPDCGEDALWRALDKVGLTPRIASLPEGLATPLGDQGAGLSGGELRRLALARVWLSPTPLVVLDEPTASLDDLSAHFVREAIVQLKAAGHTVIVSSHDALLVPIADMQIELPSQGGAHAP
ncbi:thiol reductant ABC exporter subunit CydD [Aliidiomarina sp. Khilg15.8]